MCCIDLCYTYTAVELLLPQIKLKEVKEDVSISHVCIQYHRHRLPTRLLERHGGMYLFQMRYDQIMVDYRRVRSGRANVLSKRHLQR